MPVYRVEVRLKSPKLTENSRVNHLGMTTLTGCSIARLFFIQGDVDEKTITSLADVLLCDPVVEDYVIRPLDAFPAEQFIEVMHLAGVTDTAAENLLGAIHRLGIQQVVQVATGQHYQVMGELTSQDLEELAYRAFSNPTIHRATINTPIQPEFGELLGQSEGVETVALRDADDAGLLRISQARRLSLDLVEMQAIQTYYQAEGREPTDIELEMLAQTWSEHCVHKTFKAHITYTENGGQPESIDGLLNTYIRAATQAIDKGDWIRSSFVDNAGIVAFNEEWDVAFKVETHNHPSALEPFGGANTGLGGVIRDILGVSARPIANTDVLCFGPQDLDPAAVPLGTLHPRRIQAGVVHGIEDYGNKMGIPTVNGAVLYDAGYISNPLVFCGSLGLLPRDSHPNHGKSGDYIVVLGGRTGRDGLRGATFSSMEMDSDTAVVAGSAVQIGHPINEKQGLEVILQARDEKLYNAITDCGAGGLSSAVGEMANGLGATVQLRDVPLKYSGLSPWEIWLSEAQERMVLSVQPEHWARWQELCRLHDIEAVSIGTFDASGRVTLYDGETVVGELKLDFLHDGIPTRQLTAEWSARPAQPLAPQAPLNAEESLLALLAHPNIRSKESVVRRYDHEVRGGTCIKPLANQRGHGDAAVIIPLETRQQTQGLALSNGICPSYGEYDPYAMAWAAVDEALRNLVAVGANPDQAAILDNFCWGNPTLPDRLGSLVRCSKGCYDAAIAYQTPFISGKDSLNNEYADSEGNRVPIPGTLLISALGIVPDVEHTVTADLKTAGNSLFLIGETRDEFGGSHYALVNGLSGGVAPQPVPDALGHMRQVYQAITAGLIQACHDPSEGGLAVALAEMCIAGNLGANITLPDETALFSESLTRFVVEVRPEDAEAFRSIMGDVPVLELGHVSADSRFTIGGWIDLSLEQLELAWRGEVLPISAAKSHPIKRQSPAIHTQRPRVAILHAKGTNRDQDAALACELAGGSPEIVYVNQLKAGERTLSDYHMLVLPGGFSYGDDLGAGVLWALEIQQSLQTFIESGRPVLGICNGFQALVKAGVLPGWDITPRPVTLTHNEKGQFECRWVYLKPNPQSHNLFTDGLDDLIYCPVAHGEGRIAVRDAGVLQRLWAEGLIPLTYVDENGNSASYPYNPNGSPEGIAALCNPAGNVMGLMPHPENHIFPWQNERRGGTLGISIFENAIRHS